MFEVLKIIFTSKEFYMPILFVATGVLIKEIITNTIKEKSKYKTLNYKEEIDKKKSTIVALFSNIIKYIIGILVVIAVLNVSGVNINNVIASLGIIGLIVGLAFQDIIKDFLAGVFIIFDSQYAVGDWVEIKGFKGKVISLGLKTTKIKSYTGEVKTISNSSFTEVTNFNLSNDRLLIGLQLNKAVNLEKLEKVLIESEEEIKKLEDVNKIELLGIDSFSSEEIKYVISIKCNPMTKVNVKRAILKVLKEQLDTNRIQYIKIEEHIER